MKFDLVFHHQSIAPTEAGEYLLYNQCDGYHWAEAYFFNDGSFNAFFTFMHEEFSPDTYQAWAKLPSARVLYEKFADKPVGNLSAHDVAMARLARQQAGRPQE